MRVCFLTLDFPPFRSSGLTIHAEKVVQGLAVRGHAVTVVTSRRPDHARVEGAFLPVQIDVVRVPIGRADWIGFGWQAARYLRSHQADFDIIHFADVHFAYSYRGPFVATVHQSFRQRLVACHGRPYHTNQWDYLFRLVYYNGARWLIERPAVQRARHLIAVSAAVRQEFIEHYGADPARITVVHNGVDIGRFEQLPTQEEARRRLKLPIDGPILLYVGFSTPRKGLEYLARAIRKMQTPSWLVMAGKWEARYKKRFLGMLGSARSRVLIVGYVPDVDLPLYFAAADVFVLPSLLEGFGIPLAEAMAAGVPVVTTTGGAASEVVGNAGLVVPPGDSIALAAALDRVLIDSALAYRLGRAGRERACTLFDERHIGAATESVYNLALDLCNLYTGGSTSVNRGS